jgi:hypothetical protein
MSRFPLPGIWRRGSPPAPAPTSARSSGGCTAVAIAHDILVIAWYVLHDGVEFYDLGADYFTRPDSPANDRRKDYLVRELQGMGYTVQIAPAA